MKVVHPGEPGQAVGCDTVSADRETTRMNMHKNARLTPQGRLLLVQRVRDQGWTVGSAAGAAGLSERRTYCWLARYRAGGVAALIDRSSAPQSCRHAVPGARVAEIEHWRRQRLSGPVIARRLGLPVSTVGGILRRLGLGKLAALTPRPPVMRYERERPGELIDIDTKKLGRIEAVGHRITGDRRDSTRGAGWEVVHVGIDDASRLASSARRSGPTSGGRPWEPGALPDERKTSAVPVLERAVGWFARRGVTVERVMTDNGSAYRSYDWRRACGGLALRHLRTRPYTPRTNGKAERFIQTSLREWAYARPFASSHERTSALVPWLEHSNQARPHAALAHQAPFTRLCQPAFLGSTAGPVPPSRPAITHDRSAGAAPGAPQAPGVSRREASLRRSAGPVTLEQEGAQWAIT
jgi:transposase InsO family protein